MESGSSHDGHLGQRSGKAHGREFIAIFQISDNPNHAELGARRVESERSPNNRGVCARTVLPSDALCPIQSNQDESEANKRRSASRGISEA